MRAVSIYIVGLLLCSAAWAGEREEALEKAAKSVAEVAPLAAADPTRPIAHVLPPANWTNDPNGPLLLNGTYHLFSQHNPYGKDWGHMHWAHYTSPDMVRWTQAGIALWPSLAEGEEHCFSGSAVVGPDGLPRIFYTSIGPKTNAGDAAVQWMAVGDAAGTTWQKWENNPVMKSALHGDRKVREWRDPYVWKEGNEYRCVLGGEVDGKGSVFIYSSPNLETWTFKGVLCQEAEAGRKGSWECPNFFRLGDKWVLLISREGVRYFTGTFDEKTWKFTIEKSGVADLEKRFYAPNGLVDAKDRHVLWGWVTGVGGEHWGGCLTLPRVLTLAKDGTLQSAPLPELSALRGDEGAFGKPLSPSCELEIELPSAQKGVSGVQVSNGAKENGALAFAVQWEHRQILIGDQSYSFSGEPASVKLHVFIDRSVIEVFIGDGRAVTAAWPGNGGAPLRVLGAASDGAKPPSVRMWNLNKIWP